MSNQATYHPEIFDAPDMEYARQIILTAEGSTTDERWTTETPYVADLIGGAVDVRRDTLLIDYGCGIGRLARELIGRHGCQVLGVDISARMRALAVDYVQSDRFFTCAPEMLDALVARGLRADAAISIWVLQHCFEPVTDISLMNRALSPDGKLFVLNNIYRAVPTREQAWVNDGIDIKALLQEHFVLEREGKPAESITPRDLRDIIFWASFGQRR